LNNTEATLITVLRRARLHRGVKLLKVHFDLHMTVSIQLTV